METRPDSSFTILDGITDSELYSPQYSARYALLKSIALDKNYIDTTNFNVLQPAVDYYLKNGNADERLRTYYYKGRIHRNAGDDDNAMQSYMNALELRKEVSDSLTLARILVAQATLFYKQYRIADFIDNNIEAGDIYMQLGKRGHALRCYCKALDGETRRKNQSRADSLAYLCRLLSNDVKDIDTHVANTLLEYTINFKDSDEIRHALYEFNRVSPKDFEINLARGYSRIGEYETGLRFLDGAYIASDDILDSMTYWSVKTNILENLGREADALKSYRNYSRLLEDYHLRLFSNELLFSEKKHEMELEGLEKIQERDRIIKWIMAVAGVLLFVSAFFYYRYHINKTGQKLAESNAERFRLEVDNLHLQMGALDAERDRLEGLLNRQDTLSGEARQIIRERIEMLNGLFAQAITNEEKYGRDFQKYAERIKKDKKNKEKFQASIMKVLEGTHPEFMQYLKEHGLTDREIHYVCLYAIGLRGKEIGNYLEVSGHYNISSDIRHKLGLDTKGQNLGPFIQERIGS